ncbi:Uncharacterised protein [Pseudomonas aeruginosa]|nr:Uncharacterised protein [Pseudomonas aeruginosa]
MPCCSPSTRCACCVPCWRRHERREDRAAHGEEAARRPPARPGGEEQGNCLQRVDPVAGGAADGLFRLLPGASRQAAPAARRVHRPAVSPGAGDHPGEPSPGAPLPAGAGPAGRGAGGGAQPCRPVRFPAQPRQRQTGPEEDQPGGGREEDLLDPEPGGVPQVDPEGRPALPAGLADLAGQPGQLPADSRLRAGLRGTGERADAQATDAGLRGRLPGDCPSPTTPSNATSTTSSCA